MSLELALKGLIHEVLLEAGVIEKVLLTAPAQATRGRGRPPKGEAAAASAPAAASSTSAGAVSDAPASTATSTPTETSDPFEAPPPVVPVATLDEVRAALTALKAATSQESALKVLKDVGGADNLTALKAEKYGAVVQAAKGALPPPPIVAEADDPFAAPAAAVESAPSKDELKALVVETQKRTGVDTVQKVVMKHGGKSAAADGSGEKANFSALPVSAYLAVAKELKALPTTK